MTRLIKTVVSTGSTTVIDYNEKNGNVKQKGVLLPQAPIFATQKTRILVYLRVRKVRTTLTASGISACKHAASILLVARLPFLLRKNQEYSFIYVCAKCARP